MNTASFKISVFTNMQLVVDICDFHKSLIITLKQ